MTEENKKRYRLAIRACFEKYYGEGLNEEQVRAVLSVKGPLLILAGAGSGKTTVLVNRICHIIKFGTVCESEFLPHGASEDDIFICANSNDALDRPLSSYDYKSARLIHIDGVRYDSRFQIDCFDSLYLQTPIPPPSSEGEDV